MKKKTCIHQEKIKIKKFQKKIYKKMSPISNI